MGLEAGTDEAGRGCLAGPVTAAAVILPPKTDLSLLNDSKKLSEKQRDKKPDIINPKTRRATGENEKRQNMIK